MSKNLLPHIRQSAPLIHNIANFVVMDFVANALLAMGASPVMCHAEEELEEMTGHARALVINIGTLDRYWMPSMEKALVMAQRKKIPVVLDPVGAGATSLRTQFSLKLLAMGGVTVLRANASEILALAGASLETKGVDSTHHSSEAVEAGQFLSQKFNTTVVISGPSDFVIKEKKIERVEGGDPLMAKVTGMGCVSSAVTGAFLAVTDDHAQGAVQAMELMGQAGLRAAQKSKFPASFKVHFIDELFAAL